MSGEQFLYPVEYRDDIERRQEGRKGRRVIGFRFMFISFREETRKQQSASCAPEDRHEILTLSFRHPPSEL
jgi:hypothetical protein